MNQTKQADANMKTTVDRHLFHEETIILYIQYRIFVRTNKKQALGMKLM